MKKKLEIDYVIDEKLNCTMNLLVSSVKYTHSLLSYEDRYKEMLFVGHCLATKVFRGKSPATRGV